MGHSGRHAGGRPVVRERTRLGERIQALAERRSMPLDRVAEEAGIALPTLYRIMSGSIESPRFATVQALATALGTPIHKLMGDS